MNVSGICQRWGRGEKAATREFPAARWRKRHSCASFVTHGGEVVVEVLVEVQELPVLEQLVELRPRGRRRGGRGGPARPSP